MNVPGLAQNLLESHRVGVEFLITDAQVAHTFLDTAETTTVPENRLRRIGEAHKAYDSILHFLTKLTPTPEQQKALDGELEPLRRRLEALGVRLV